MQLTKEQIKGMVDVMAKQIVDNLKNKDSNNGYTNILTQF
jgi:hypothetical protein